jgi:hypothetical protein
MASVARLRTIELHRLGILDKAAASDPPNVDLDLRAIVTSIDS